MRMLEPLSLTYWPKDHLLANDWAKLVSFSFYFSFFSFPLIFHFNMFLDLQMLGFCCGISLDENLTPQEG